MEAIANPFRNGGELLAAGHGGSAAEAQRVTAEFVGRLHRSRERGASLAVVVHADSSALTVLDNDDWYERVFARRVAAIERSGDVLVLSASGASRNLLTAVETATYLGIATIGLVRGDTPACTNAALTSLPSPSS